MSGTTIDLETLERLQKIANLDIDSALKMRQHAYAPWQLVISAMSVGAAVGGVAVALIVKLI